MSNRHTVSHRFDPIVARHASVDSRVQDADQSPVPLAVPGIRKTGGLLLEAGCGAQVHAPVAGRGADNAERSAKDVGVGEPPSRVIEYIVEAGENLQTGALLEPKRLGHGNVPLKRIPVAEE